MTAMTDITLRPATAADAPALEALIRDAYAPHAARLPDLPDVAGGIAEDIARHRVIVATGAARLLGGIVLIAGDDHLMIANVAVAPAALGRGVGRALIDKADAVAREMGLRTLRLATHAGMPENVALYAHLGWQVTDRQGNKVRMQKTL